MKHSPESSIVRAVRSGSSLSRALLLALLGTAFLALTPRVSSAQCFQFEKLFPGASSEIKVAAADGGSGVVLGGLTKATFGLPAYYNATLARHDAAGNLLWFRTFQSSVVEADEYVAAVIPDGSGGFFVGGTTEGDLGGSPQAPNFNVWVARVDGNGSILWIRQLDLADDNFCSDLVEDGAGGIFVCGDRWAVPFTGEADALVARLDASGNILWVHTFGTAQSEALLGAARGNAPGVFVGGRTEGALGGTSFGGADAWLARLDLSGNVLWTRQIGTSANDATGELAADFSGGGVYFAGTTQGNLGGPSSGGWDVWAARCDGAGNLLWLDQFGSAQDDALVDVESIDPVGLLASGTLAGTNHWLKGWSQAGAVQFSHVAPFDVGFWTAMVWSSASRLFVAGTSVSSATVVYLARLGLASNYCSGTQSQHGCTPQLSSSGSASLSHSQAFQALALDLPGQQNGLLFFGTSGSANLPWVGGGLLCVAPPLYRLDLKNSRGTNAACDGALAYTLGELLAHPAGGPLIAAGQPIYCQAWLRDPQSASAVVLSDALVFEPCP